MPAEVETLMYVSNESNGRFVPWHGLGTAVEEAPNSKEAIRIAGLDWKVNSMPIYTNGTEIPGYRANVRDIDGAVLGVTKSRYQITQNEDAFEFTDSLVGGEVKYETAGSLAGGKRVFLLAQLPEEKILGDEIIPYVCFTNGFDGSHPVQVCLTPTRVVCQNTLNLALRDSPRKWSTKHVGDIKGKLEQARETLNLSHKYMKELNETAEQLVDTKISEDEAREVLDKVFVVDEKATERRANNMEEQKNDFMVCMLAPDIAKFKGTAWQMVQAASDYFTHKAPKRNTNTYKEKNFEKVLDGNSYFDKIFLEMLGRVKKNKGIYVGV